MREWLVNYIKDNFDDLLRADLKLARVLGAPKGWTLSGYSYHLEQLGKPWGKFWRPIIDKVFLWLFNDVNHCADAHKSDQERVKRASL
jgi:hypothetical protein